MGFETGLETGADSTGFDSTGFEAEFAGLGVFLGLVSVDLDFFYSLVFLDSLALLDLRAGPYCYGLASAVEFDVSFYFAGGASVFLAAGCSSVFFGSSFFYSYMGSYFFYSYGCGYC